MYVHFHLPWLVVARWCGYTGAATSHRYTHVLTWWSRLKPLYSKQMFGFPPFANREATELMVSRTQKGEMKEMHSSVHKWWCLRRHSTSDAEALSCTLATITPKYGQGLWNIVPVAMGYGWLYSVFRMHSHFACCKIVAFSKSCY